MIKPKVITPAVKPLISLEEAKLACKVEIDNAYEDLLFDTWIGAATDYIESHSDRTAHETTLEVTADSWPGCSYIHLPRATPLISITSVIYTDSDGAETTWGTSEYAADTDTIPGRLMLGYNYSWPSVTLPYANGIRIRYKAGIANASGSEAPAWMKHACQLLVSAMYSNRSNEVHPDRAALDTILLKNGAKEFIEMHRASSICY